MTPTRARPPALLCVFLLALVARFVAGVLSGSQELSAGQVWAALRSLGRSGLAELFESNCRQARRFAARLAGAGYEILNDVTRGRLRQTSDR